MKGQLNKLFWFTNPQTLDVKHDQALIIHHTLAYGSLDDIAYLLEVYPKKVIKKTFLQGRRGEYSPAAVAFARELLDIRRLNFDRYITHAKKTYSLRGAQSSEKKILSRAE